MIFFFNFFFQNDNNPSILAQSSTCQSFPGAGAMLQSSAWCSSPTCSLSPCLLLCSHIPWMHDSSESQTQPSGSLPHFKVSWEWPIHEQWLSKMTLSTTSQTPSPWKPFLMRAEEPCAAAQHLCGVHCHEKQSPTPGFCTGRGHLW